MKLERWGFVFAPLLTVALLLLFGAGYLLGDRHGGDAPIPRVAYRDPPDVDHMRAQDQVNRERNRTQTFRIADLEEQVRVLHATRTEGRHEGVVVRTVILPFLPPPDVQPVIELIPPQQLPTEPKE